MYFYVQQSGETLVVKSDTYWNCNSYGNIKLSKYSGSGNTEIDLVLPDDMDSGNGRVMFSYGDGRCEYPSIYVYMTNECWIRTEPMYDSKKEINLSFSNENDIISIKVFTNNDYAIYGNDVFKNDNEILVKAGSNVNQPVIIKPISNCEKEIKLILCKLTE